MSKSIFAALALSMTVGLFAAEASAGPRGGGIDHREARQIERIVNGIQDGSLTRREARDLFRSQIRIRAYEARAKADGRFTRRERIKLRRKLDRQSRRIWWKKHN